MNETKLTEFLKDDVKIRNNETTFCNTHFLAGGFPHLVSPMASTEEVTGQIKRDGFAEEESDLLRSPEAGRSSGNCPGPGPWSLAFQFLQPPTPSLP